MKRFIGIICVFLFIFILVKGTFAQPVQDKKFEFSTSAAMWNIKIEGSDAETIFNVPLRIGYFIYKGLELEPEILLTIPEDGGTGILIQGNLSYNFKASEKVFPFILGGFGFGNAQKIFGIAMDTDENVTVLNFGAGMKFMVGNSAAIRVEYRLTKYSMDIFERTDNNFLVGVSIFF
jgi:hypothetical protein